MAEYLAPGVFLEEVDLKPPSIEAVSTSTTGMVGHAERGATVGPPVLVTNLLQFRQAFGGPLPVSTGSVGELFYAAQGFFANGGRRLYVIRAAGSGALRTRFDTRGGFVTRLAVGADAAVGTTALTLASTLGMRAGSGLTLSFVQDGVTYGAGGSTIAAGGVDPATGAITLTAPISIAPAGKPAFPATATAVTTTFNGLSAAGAPTTGARPNSVSFEAIDPGSWGDRVAITTRHVAGARAAFKSMIGGAVDDNKVELKGTALGLYPDAWVEIDRGAGADRIFRRVIGVSGAIVTLSGAALAATDLDPVAPATETVLTVREFAMTVSVDGAVETYPSLTLANVPGKSLRDQIARSRIVRLDITTLPATIADTHPFRFPSADDGLTLRPTAVGTDAPPTAVEMRGADGGPGARTGLRALEEVEDISIIVAPGWGDVSVQGAMIEQCERLKYRVALLDPEVTGGIAPTLTQIQNQRSRYDTKYAAIYYPRVIIRDAQDQPRAIGPAGHMAGLCARIDNERGVYKSPGNETIRAIVDLEAIVTKGEHEILNPRNINVIRDFRQENRGIRIYGARCVTSFSDWRYLAVRRLFIAIERSIEIGTQWAVLEPNGPRLWDRLIDSIDSFLTTWWRDGALLGEEKGQAFYIRCGTATMTTDDIDNGRLVMEIGIAPTKPAEFVIIRVSQTPSGLLAVEA